MAGPRRTIRAVLRWAGAVLGIVTVLLVVGGTVSFAHSRGMEPRILGGWVLLCAALSLGLLSLFRWALRSVGVLPRTCPVRQPAAASAGLSYPNVGAWNEEDTRTRVEAEIRLGRLWRAKEILRGQIGTYPYDPALYGAYGDVLLRMGDKLEAGKYLFLAGREDPQATDAIATFLKRFSHPGHLWAQLPTRARLHELDGFPASVAGEMRRRGVKPSPSQVVSADARPIGTWAWLDAAWGGFIGVLFFLSVVTGLIVIAKAVGEAVFG